jgi:cholinesterase
MDKGIYAWRYRWMGVFPNQHIANDAGAWHGSEIPHIFGTIAIRNSKLAPTADQLKVSELMNSAWAAFAKDPEAGLSKLGWPLYNKKGTIICSNTRSVTKNDFLENSLVLLADNSGPGATFALGEKYDDQCSLLKNNIQQLL